MLRELTVQNSVKDIKRATELNWPESNNSSSFTLLKMTRIQELFRANIELVIKKHGLQHADFTVLATLRRSPAPHCLSPTDLYKQMFFSSGGLTKVLGRLERAELISRLDNPEDKRSKLVKLTTIGKQKVEQIMPDLHSGDNLLLSSLSEQELFQLQTILNKILLTNGE